MLRGTERVRYCNNSPDTLTIYLVPPLLQCLSAGVPVVRRGQRRAQAPVQRPQGSRFRHEPRPERPDHGAAGRRRSIRSRPTAPSSGSAARARCSRATRSMADLEWDARPSTVPRRQGRQGRAFDFAQWYPRVVAYESSAGRSIRSTRRASFTATSASSRSARRARGPGVGATGVPRSAATPAGSGPTGTRPDRSNTARDSIRLPSPNLAGRPAGPGGPGRKTIVWRAEDVHHFAMSMRPDYRYEGGHWGDVSRPRALPAGRRGRPGAATGSRCAGPK